MSTHIISGASKPHGTPTNPAELADWIGEALQWIHRDRYVLLLNTPSPYGPTPTDLDAETPDLLRQVAREARWHAARFLATDPSLPIPPAPSQDPADSVDLMLHWALAQGREEASEDPHAPYLPAAHFKQVHGIGRSRLSEAYRGGRLPAVKAGKNWHYSEPAARKLWPNEMAEAPKSDT